jgi:hypothetical protein
MKNKTSKGTVERLTVQQVAEQIIENQYSANENDIYAAIEALDEQRMDGSRATTARKLIEAMTATLPTKTSVNEISVALNFVVLWLYYRKDAAS